MLKIVAPNKTKAMFKRCLLFSPLQSGDETKRWFRGPAADGR